VSNPGAAADRAGFPASLHAAYRADETECVRALLAAAGVDADEQQRICKRAVALVEHMRAERPVFGGIDQILQEFDLSSQEGVLLLCLAEALLRIPDADTIDELISDKLGSADWESHISPGKPLFVNAATWMLMLTGAVVGGDDAPSERASRLERMLSRLGRPVVRRALSQAMRVLGGQFILGRTIEEALQAAASDEHEHYRHSFDMLGESARGASDAQRYLDAYAHAIEHIEETGLGGDPVHAPGISVKLSALHPRYEYAQRSRVLRELTPRLLELALLARAAGIGLTVDAEEADRLELSLEVFAAAWRDTALAGWEGMGLAVQAYQKRAPHVVDWLVRLSGEGGRRLPVRLVKGAYWDTEIKRAQERGLDGYPVYTRKASTDLGYLVCVRRLLAAGDRIYPQFATHNAHTVAAVIELADARRDLEFQRLHGMGETLYRQIVGPHSAVGIPCRVYAPVGTHEDLLAYLVRRLLENGANTSFVNRIADSVRPAAEVIADPLVIVPALLTANRAGPTLGSPLPPGEGLGVREKRQGSLFLPSILPPKAAGSEPSDIPHPRVPLPRDLYLPERLNARAFDLSDSQVLGPLLERLELETRRDWSAGPIVAGSRVQRASRVLTDPSDRGRVIGRTSDAEEDDVVKAIESAARAAPQWDRIGTGARSKSLERMATLIEAHYEPLMALAVREAGKTIADALAEVREAADFCRYYAARARDDLGVQILRGPTGEHNELQWHGRGVWACISPWNFPLAIFTGQIAAALAAGNCVLAKPAEQTPLIAALAVELFHRAGIPTDVLHLLPGAGEKVGAQITADPRIGGIVFTGSVETAQAINRALAARSGAIVPLIAETGGQNAMIVDSTALPEQVVDNVLASAFRSAGQRCSALRVLFLQDEVAERIAGLLCEAAAELRIGDPGLIETDVGPVIDDEALRRLEEHCARMSQCARTLYAAPLGSDCAHGSFLGPRIFEIDRLSQVPEEVFGPILHIVRYAADDLDHVIDAINATRYGLTLGIQTRIDGRAREIQQRLKVGNAYVNRNTIGAVVGVQPFGGEGLSGTGPKAGGPNYLQRFAVERVLTIDTSASGGNTSLANLGD
jgi:RHH-type transcriptional regulator, proline utilization regulon repressor / proline dehydrogenase / delta 1-pyrroline-5-carboxylate dehydrogenase